MPANQFPAPTRRADAERNRDKILAAARTAFADPDAEVSMAGISRRAGVGMATLYRNFPGRQELLEALCTDEVNAVCKAAETIGGETPGAALAAWLHRFSAFTTSKRHIAAELLKQTDRSDPLSGGNRARVAAAGRPLLAAAQHAREVRGDLALEQILDMIVAIATIHGGTGYTEPILQTALDGLRPGRCEARIGPGGTPPRGKAPALRYCERRGSPADARPATSPATLPPRKHSAKTDTPAMPVAALQSPRGTGTPAEQHRLGSSRTRARSECCTAPQNLALTSPDLKPPTFLTYTRGSAAEPGMSVPHG